MNNDKDDELLTVSEEEAGERLDKVLAARYEGRYSRTYFQMLIAENLVLVNDSPVKKRIQVQSGDEIEIQFAYTREITLVPEPIPLDILYEDEAIIVVNKQKGLVVHPAPGNWTGTLVNALLHHCQSQSWDPASMRNLRPGIVHRLDKDTTGVLVAAKTLFAQQKLTESFANREVYKEYLAITLGNPGKKTVEAPIGRHPRIRQKMSIVEGGKAALSQIETIKPGKSLSLVKVVISTGRTHQIRLHLSSLKTPVLGDSTYGSLAANQKYKAERPYLHASCLRIKHPITNEEMSFSAPFPEDMQQMLEGQL